jgi:putative transposase
MNDSLKDGRSIRIFNVIDDFNHECLTIDVALSLPTQRVIRSFNQTIEAGVSLLLFAVIMAPNRSVNI